MKPSAFFVVVAWALFGFLGLGFSLAPAIEGLEADFEAVSSITYNYDRVDEVKKECKSVLSSASELKQDDSRVYSIQRDLFFEKGDWVQVKGEAPIMPFDVRYRIEKDSTLFNSLSNQEGDPMNLVSFQVRDVSLAHRSKKSVSISGTLNLAITTGGDSYGYGGNPEFRIWPGTSYLVIEFEGVYTESEKNGGERVVCMLGNAMLPSRDSESSNPWEWVNASLPYSNERPPLAQDDRILLVLRFPKKFSLTSRAIQGEMRSLNAKSNQKYFDDVHIVSQLGKQSSAMYEFTSDKLVSKACDPYPYNKTDGSLLVPGISVYKGNQFCEIFEEITSNQPFTVLPNWKCSGKDEFCSKLGPFGINKEINKTDGGFKGVSLYVKVVKCDQSNGRSNTSSARLSVEFRASPPSENRYTATRRSGMGNLTVAAEGIWKSTSGQLCMIGCPGIVDHEGNGCDSRICLYIPTSFTVKQRSIMYGTLSSISTNTPSYFPLSFEKLINHPSDLWNYFRGSHPTYSYSKITRADAILERNEEFSLRTMIKKSLLKYPKLEDAEDYQVSLSLLSEDLTFHTPATLDSNTPKSRLQRTNIQMDILSVGPLFGRYFSRNDSNFVSVEGGTEIPFHTKAEYTENQLLLNVSAQLSVAGEEYKNISVLFLEGIYDQRVGKMYLVGCRDVRASWEILHDSQDLEAGLDCFIDVIVSYPPTTARWLVDPLAKISIASQRNDDDPLRFSQVKFQTFPITYRKQREDLLSRRGIEGILRILTLSFAIACITAQLFHTQKNTDSVPYMSLVMLGVQAIGYSIPLVTGAEALFKKASSESYQSSYDLESSRWFHVLDYTVKLLVMVSLILTLRLCQKVWKSRVRLLTRAPLEPHRVPSDKKVLLSTVAIHVVGYLLVLMMHSKRGDQRTRNYEYIRENSHIMSEWEAELEEYVGLVQDFFLLPQVIGNLIWQIDCQSLGKLYYFGITLVRLLPHLYDYIRAPNIPYFPEEYEFVDPNMDFYSKFGDIAIPVTAVVLAILVYVQQKLSYEKLSQCLTFGRFRLLPSASRIYERLPSSSKAFETELASSVNGGNDANEKDHDLE
ncbi:hypothetical protein F8388_027093 [Cannabis sativa]|uniref:RING-type E3 ubiquitin transferase n=2 Tax=Cannabis sativa TaxID=3483 RepID=A0A7J6FRH2_CANSA|nr:hypothetical protein F8388_027093 [Cannabis sativa]KAF4387791.1 hypothetical protein G4B88_004118 [Cannabis sativa]